MNDSDYPHKWNEADGECERVNEEFFDPQRRPIGLGNRCWVTEVSGHVARFAPPWVAEDIYRMKLRPDDIFVVSYPKTGQTWMLDTIRCLLADDHSVLEQSLLNTVPFLETAALIFSAVHAKKDFPSECVSLDESLKVRHDFLENMTSPRLFKTHLPLDLLPPDLLSTCKVIYCVRNIKDTFVSYFYHLKKEGLRESVKFETCVTELLKPGLHYPGDYWKHLHLAWQSRNEDNLHIVWYEDMKKDLPGCIKDIGCFTGRPVTEAKAQLFAEKLGFDNYKNVCQNNKISLFDGQFTRKGIVGDYKNHFSADFLKTFDDWIDGKLRELSLESLRERQFV